ncbi:ribonuclease P protein subunit p14-like [Drosophila albomicans]|uniref:Ribonuclease P protein subunit p14-like n=1 Tax=Drosophila albomicans TaxID=7291 RepID=A0A6P8XQH3_DROAB|nr:ribonuclease P protein subunit p14-like [Drosophila albomicans]
MIRHRYFDVQLKFRDLDSVVLTPVFFRGCVQNSLERFFGQIGGDTTLEIIKFSAEQQRVVFRVPEEFYERTRASITLIGQYQEVPCHFRVLKTSKTPLDFIKEGENENCEEI